MYNRISSKKVFYMTNNEDISFYDRLITLINNLPNNLGIIHSQHTYYEVAVSERLPVLVINLMFHGTCYICLSIVGWKFERYFLQSIGKEAGADFIDVGQCDRLVTLLEDKFDTNLLSELPELPDHE